jgi:aminoglycoside phosphotransferase family enzyme/predicted kinase
MAPLPGPGADHVVADQSEIAAFLAAPAAYGPDVHRVERIDTHGAMVFLAGTRAYKLKRAVHFPYMDFSTLERRRAACAREVALNRRTAPDLYLGAEPVVRRPDGALAVGGEGEAVDWLVVMRRFDQDSLCDRMAQAGRLTPELVQALADEIAAFHEAAERLGRGDAPGGGADGLLAILAENETELAERPDLFAPEEVALFTRAARAAHGRLAALLDRRLAEGLVRRCHGDLHLRNICVVDGRPTIFDAIEFNDAIACIDVLYDLAFLLMDLDHRALRGFANQVLNRYLQQREDLEGLAALPLFLSTRAAVRAKVSVSVAATQTDRAAARRLCDEACAYFRAARAYLDPAPARLVAIGGLSGTGKTNLGRALAPRFGPPPGALHLRSDVLRKTLHGVDELTPLPLEAYAPGTSERVYAELAARARVALDAGRAAIVDAVYARPGERAAIEALADELGVPFIGLWLEAPEEVMAGRVAGRRADASDATPEIVRRQLGYDLGEVTWHRLDATGARDTVAEAADRVLAA